MLDRDVERRAPRRHERFARFLDAFAAPAVNVLRDEGPNPALGHEIPFGVQSPERIHHGIAREAQVRLPLAAREHAVSRCQASVEDRFAQRLRQLLV